ncbi:hypothetical protein KIN20_010609 [Parelaphostrongylus tenuis]|uniref:Uncharacterized protein n=1 Tax=Parelaphostrongylus tenuis TaxID=148309 RepID=A0AAD5QKC1_PARTN|nr:hypothetical protein KIN20_010609 [Parelaphostrongylus tenuis]
MARQPRDQYCESYPHTWQCVVARLYAPVKGSHPTTYKAVSTPSYIAPAPSPAPAPQQPSYYLPPDLYFPGFTDNIVNYYKPPCNRKIFNGKHCLKST